MFISKNAETSIKSGTKKLPRTGFDYGIKSRCYPTPYQEKYYEEILDKVNKFWNILVYEQIRPLWTRNREIRDIADSKKPQFELLKGNSNNSISNEVKLLNRSRPC